MDARPRRRRKDTRQRIQDVALELFLERGYDQTSLREIAERLDVTKAALYYHFKTKEEIVGALVGGVRASVDEILAWGAGRPRTLETRVELLRRLHAVLDEGRRIFRFLQENQAALRKRESGDWFRDQLATLGGLISAPEASMVDRARVMSAIFTISFGTFAMAETEGDPGEKRAALLQVAGDLLAAIEPEAE
ncbi:MULTISPECIES: TetR/AcrR family transcriptional regulator [Thermomonosporaceae]|uniref:TetR/AcrR family transcriptional regulator n=1 Tax=Thermomonosporaceae TaxID=2012 RepID=UPI00255A7424|nr:MULTISPECIES: TetR/AcrR family transcriptional regulator [Thermomonosporaceae]MDL4772576.1 helix-turn-helix domain-containing protein [Actinomadura xylanilytica]